MSLESNTTASRNGKSIEMSILRYMGLPQQGQPVDSELDGKPLEVKSCQLYITDVSCGKSRRSGRFQFNEEQDRYLKENDGRYALVVHDEGIIHHTRLLRASLIEGIVGRACGKPWRMVIQ